MQGPFLTEEENIHLFTQIQQKAIQGDRRYLFAPSNMGEVELHYTLKDGTTPVSYTHLDVYKRQGNRHPVTQVTAIVPLVPASATHWMVGMLRISVEMTCKINMMTR